jgi:hypothetical protein
MQRHLEKNFNYYGQSTKKYCIVGLKYVCAESLRAHYTGQDHHVDSANKNVQLDVDTGEQIVEEDQE